MLGLPTEDAALTQGRRLAISQWDTEGGAGPCGPQESTAAGPVAPAIPELTNTELVQLRVRVIALENLVLALLSGASEQQLAAATDMAALISPRLGALPHPLTIQAATQMRRLVTHSAHFTATDRC